MTKEVRKRIMERDKYTCRKCLFCSPNGSGLRIDHTIPVAAGGLSTDDNLQVLCEKCSSEKSDKIR